MTDSKLANAKDEERPGLDALAEDVFGLNVRGIKTIWHLISKPSEVFAAARDVNWEGRFTPSIRLYFSLIALLIFFQFIWAGEQSYMREAFRMQFEQMQTMPEFRNVHIERATDLAIDTYLILSPIVIGVCLLLTACCIFVWGKGTSFVTRIRLFFAALIPNTTLSLFLTMAGSFAPIEQSMMLAIVTFISMFVINGITVYRGLKPVHSGVSRVWRALTFTCIAMISITLAGVLSQLIVGIWAGMQIARADMAMLASSVFA